MKVKKHILSVFGVLMFAAGSAVLISYTVAAFAFIFCKNRIDEALT